MNGRPNIEMKPSALLVVIALVLAACGPSGDDPAEEPGPSTTPAEVTSDSSAYDPATSDEELDPAETPAAEPGTVGKPDQAGDDQANVHDGTPNETEDPEVPLSDLPAPTLDPPKYPDTEPVIPPPRD